MVLCKCESQSCRYLISRGACQRGEVDVEGEVVKDEVGVKVSGGV
jgi:hypothetical protein